jgi:hypothetical protein
VAGDSLTKTKYLEINKAFVDKYGDKAGWAH